MLDVEVAAKLGVSSRGPGVAFPYIIEGQKLYDKVRDPESKANTRCTPTGVEQTALWNEDCLKGDPQPNDVLIITEGELDAIAVLQVGYRFVVSLPSGAASKPEGCRSKAEKCLTFADKNGDRVLKADIEKFSKVIVLTDGDHDGLLMRKAIVDVIGDDYCWVPRYAEGVKDANDVLMSAGGAAALRAMIEAVDPIKSDGFVDFISAFSKSKRYQPLNCGVQILAPHFRPIRPSLIVIGGRAGQGKSTITQALLFSLLHANESLRASVFHAEGDVHIPIQRSKVFWKGRNLKQHLHFTEELKAQRDAWISERLAFIEPPQDEPPTFEWVLWAMERQALHRGRNVFVIDPWNQVVHNFGRQNKTDYIGECILKMKALAKRLNLILIVAHHTTKASDPREPPTEYDLADSAHWANAADHLLLGWRPRKDVNVTRLEVAKSKDHHVMGRPGVVWVGMTEGRAGASPTAFELELRADPRGEKFAEEVAKGKNPNLDQSLEAQYQTRQECTERPPALDTMSKIEDYIPF